MYIGNVACIASIASWARDVAWRCICRPARGDWRSSKAAEDRPTVAFEIDRGKGQSQEKSICLYELRLSVGRAR